MKLRAVTIQKFRNFVEPQRIEIEDDVTVLVGKNESGKTTVLRALHRLKPANGDQKKFDLVTEYPRWRLSRDRREGALEKVRPVTAEFIADAADREALEGKLPGALLPSTTIYAARDYANSYFVWVSTPTDDVIAEAASAASVDPSDLDDLVATGNLDSAIELAKERGKEVKESAPPRSKALLAFPKAAEQLRFLVSGALEDEPRAALAARIPSFFYFSNYSVLPGEADLTLLAEKVAAGESLDEAEQTVVSLLAHAGVTPSDFLDDNYDSRKAELQAASTDLSREVFQYWKANTDLDVVFDDDNVTITNPNGTEAQHRILKIELRDARHGNVETNFSTRSTGFQWFFSFFAAFSEYLHRTRPVIVLLDEPGTSLHGEAQKDFVNYIFNELGASKQTLYTTHSQFMIDPSTYEKLRAVHDKATRDDQEAGVAVTHVNLSADRDTILPVESALGYSISQHLFLGSGKHLLVEGSSDFVYLMRMSAYMETKKKVALDPNVALIPVGGIKNMPAFVALMGRRLQVSVLVDGPKASAILDRVRKAASDNGLPERRIVAVSEVSKTLPATADIEDLFSVADYLKLYNWAFRASIQPEDLPTTPVPIIKKLHDYIGSDFDHALPAHALTEHQAEFFAGLAKESIDNFAAVFKLLNKAAS
jgi:ABC-type transport system involved in cytochrome c biogenesis ATPase subunit